mgnify:CR=1 FL=1
MKSYLFVAYIAEAARITKKTLIAWDAEMKKSLLMTALLVPVVLAEACFTVEIAQSFPAAFWAISITMACDTTN